MNSSDLISVAVFGSTTATEDLPRLLPQLMAASAIYYLGPSLVAKDASTLGIKVLAPATDMLAAVHRLHESGVTGDVFVLALDAELPAYTIKRIQQWMQTSNAEIISPLGTGEDDLSPLPEDIVSTLDSAALDNLCFLLGDRHSIATRSYLPHAALWRESARSKLVNGTGYSNNQFTDSIQAEVLPTLFIGRKGIAPCGPKAAADRRYSPPASPLSTLRLRIGPAPKKLPLALPGIDGRPVILHVLHSWGGGIERFVRDLAAADLEHIHLALRSHGEFSRRCYGESLSLSIVNGERFHSLRHWPLPLPIDDTVISDQAYRQLLNTITANFCVSGLIVSSLIGHSLDVLATGLPTTTVCHDYYPLWPVLHADFGDSSIDFSGASLTGAIAEADDSGFPFQNRDSTYWNKLRESFIDILRQRQIPLIAPSECVRRNWLRIAPDLQTQRFVLIPHGFRPFALSVARPTPVPNSRLRLVVLGRINGGKAEHLLQASLTAITQYADVFLIGCGSTGHKFFGYRHVHILLDYEREDLPQLIAEINPDAALMPATVAESFSYTLSELWSLGVAPIATRLGSFVERIQDGANGILIDAHANAISEQVAALARDRKPLQLMGTNLHKQLLNSIEDARHAHMALLAPAKKADAAFQLTSITPVLIENSQLADKLMALDRQIKELTHERTEHIQELEARADWAMANARALRHSQVELQHLQVEFENRSEWAQALDQDNRRLGSDLQIAYDNYQALERDKAAADIGWSQELARVEKLRQELLASTSWRITRPLRAIKSRISGLRAQAGYWSSRLFSAAPRLSRSLRTRGLKGTWDRIHQGATTSLLLEPLTLTVALQKPDADFLPFALAHSESPKASIVIPVYNKFSYTLACLQSIAEHGANIGFEVIVVDDNSTDETASALNKISGLRVLRNDSNLGFVGACNAGAAEAHGEYLIFLNNDTQVTPGWLDTLIDTFTHHRLAGLVGAKLVYPDGRLQEAGGIVFADASGWNYGRFADPRDPAFNYVREVDYCSGAAIAVPRELFNRLGGFDTRYAPAYYEDTDLAFQVREAGLRVLYQPAATVIHFEGITSGTDINSGTKRYQSVNQQKFAERWRGVLSRQPQAGANIAAAREHRVTGRILIIDATVPEPDKDSGSLRMLNLIHILLELGWKVTFLSENRAYSAGYTETLQQLGVEVLYHPWLRDPVTFLRETGSLWNAVMLSRHYVAAPLLPLVRAYAPRARIIFDTVDLHYLREERAAALDPQGHQKRNAANTKLAELRLVKASDITLVVSPVEQALLRQEVPDAHVEVISNVHDVIGSRKAFEHRRDLFFVGGFQHQPNVDAVFWFVAEIWPWIAAALPDVKFHIVGSRMPESILQLASERIIATGFVESLDAYLDGCRLSVAPLRFGAGVKGKINQSMAHGQPVVATTLAAEGMHLNDGVDILIADNARDFADATVRLYRDELLWQRLSNGGIENVQRYFSFASAKSAMCELLR